MKPGDFCQWLSGVLDTIKINDDGSNLGVSRMVEMLDQKLKTVEFVPKPFASDLVLSPVGEWRPAFETIPVRKDSPPAPSPDYSSDRPGDLGHE